MCNRHHPFLSIAVSVIILLMATPNPAWAFLCGHPPMTELFDKSDAVFIGHVGAVGKPVVLDSPYGKFPTITAPVNPMHIWKGELERQITIHIPYLAGYNDPLLSSNTIYLLFVHYADNKMYTSSCEMVGPLPQSYIYILDLLDKYGQGKTIEKNLLRKQYNHGNKQKRTTNVHP